MCGICGVVQIRGRPREVVSLEVLERMTDVMTHRGPDDRGLYAAPGIALGARRLSIVDVVAGHQPFANEDETFWGIQNGELYNHEAIRSELQGKGHTFRTRCDTEILPHLFEEAGEQLPSRLRGKFALCVWDATRRRALIARDRLGVKPLYYAVGRRRRRLRLRAEVGPRERPRHARPRPRGDRRLPDLRLLRGADDAAPRGAQAPARPPADRRGRRQGRALLGVPRAEPRPDHERGRGRRGAPRDARGRRPGPADERRSARGDALAAGSTRASSSR